MFAKELAPFSVFVNRVLSALILALIMILIGLTIGISGYHWIAELGWIDSLLEASMILGGMGSVNTLRTDSAKIFASFYALFSGVMFIGVMGVVLSPIVHHFLHRFHIDDEDLKSKQRKK